MSNADEIMLEMNRILKQASVHSVVSGETVSGIARHLGLSVDDLITANPGINPTAIRPGQAINIPTPEEIAANRAANGLPKINNIVDIQQQIDTAIAAACSNNGLREALFRGLIHTESRGDYCAKSGAGASGLCQLMPATQTAMNVTDPRDPIQSVYAGARWLALCYGEANRMMGKYKPNSLDLDDVALMIYNAGGPRVSTYLRGGSTLPKETLEYPHKVKSNSGARISFSCSNRQV